MKAYVFINVESGKSPYVVSRLREIEAVKAADPCWGLPDIIALVEVPELKALQELMLNRVQKITEVKQTDTHIVWEA